MLIVFFEKIIEFFKTKINISEKKNFKSFEKVKLGPLNKDLNDIIKIKKILLDFFRMI
jgi:hypothetical protein